MNRTTTIAAVRKRLPAAIVALAAGGAAVAGSYAAAGFTPAYIVAPVELFLAQYMPGAVITFAIVVLGDLGKKVSLLSATLLSAVILGALAGLGRALAGRLELEPLAAPFAGIPVWAATAALTHRPVLALGAGLGAALIVGIASIVGRTSSSEAPSPARRRVVGSLASVAGLSAVGWFLGNRGTGASSQPTPPTPEPEPESEPESTPADDTPADDTPEAAASSEETPAPTETERLLAEADRKSFEVEGLEPLVSERFYTVDISSVDPQVSAQEWSLSVTGAVPEERSFDYREVVQRESTLEFSTLRCVGERLNGKKTDTALWEGVRVGDLLEAANVPDRCCVMAHAADSYYEEFPVAALEDSLLAYRMNGEPLPRSHGYPARLIVPGHWGEIHVKWVDELEILAEPAKGYWEKKGWHGTGPVNTVAKLYVVNDLADGRKQVAGHAYAGTRGVRAVEVSTDGGTTWNEAELTEPLPGRSVWRQWKYEYDPPDGAHKVVVRAIDGEGNLQPQADSGPYPSGASGWVSKIVR